MIHFHWKMGDWGRLGSWKTCEPKWSRCGQTGHFSAAISGTQCASAQICVARQGTEGLNGSHLRQKCSAEQGVESSTGGFHGIAAFLRFYLQPRCRGGCILLHFAPRRLPYLLESQVDDVHLGRRGLEQSACTHRCQRRIHSRNSRQV